MHIRSICSLYKTYVQMESHISNKVRGTVYLVLIWDQVGLIWELEGQCT